jgi:hypothetical protein
MADAKGFEVLLDHFLGTGPGFTIVVGAGIFPHHPDWTGQIESGAIPTGLAESFGKPLFHFIPRPTLVNIAINDFHNFVCYCTFKKGSTFRATGLKLFYFSLFVFASS